MPRNKEQPRDPHTGQWAKEYVFDLEDTRIPERPRQRQAGPKKNPEKTFDRDKGKT
jgi:hypothetical protein